MQTYVSAVGGIQERRKMVMCVAPEGLPATQSFSGHVLHFLYNRLKFSNPFEMEALWLSWSGPISGDDGCMGWTLKYC